MDRSRLELLAVAVIVASIVVTALPRVARLHAAVERHDVFSGYKQRMGRGLLLGLELLLAGGPGRPEPNPSSERLTRNSGRPRETNTLQQTGRRRWKTY